MLYVSSNYSTYLHDLRQIILRSVYVFVASYFVFTYFFPKIFSRILSATGLGPNSVFSFGVGSVIGFYFTAPAVLAFLFTLPIFLIMFYSWVQDALLPEEKAFVARYAKVSVVLFVIGVLISVPIVPRLISLAEYLASSLHVRLIITAQEVFNIWLSMALALGIVFQFPILLSFLIRTGIVTKRRLREIRRYVYPVFYVFAAVITPGDLLVTDVILFAIFVALYETSIALTPSPHRNA